MKEPRYMKAWLIFFVIGFVGGAAAAFLVFTIGIQIIVRLGLEPETAQAGGKILAYLAAATVSFLAYRWTAARFIVAPLLSPDVVDERIQPPARGDGKPAPQP